MHGHFTQVAEHTPVEVRGVLRALLCGAEWEPVISDVLFVATELLTNVRRHTDGRCYLTVLVEARGVHVHVRDYSTDLPVQVDAGEDDESGRGVLAVLGCVTDFR